MFLNHRIAACHIALGDAFAAAAAVRSALSTPEDYVVNELCAIERGAHIAAVSGHPDRGALLLGYVESRMNDVGLKREPMDEACTAQLIRELHKRLSEERLQGLMVAGAALQKTYVIEKTLSAMDEVASGAAANSSGT